MRNQTVVARIIAGLLALSLNCFGETPKTTGVDRSTFEAFLTAVYPAIERRGMLTFQVVRNDAGEGDPLYVYFKPCIPGFPNLSGSGWDREHIYCDGLYGEAGVRDPQYLRMEFRRSTGQQPVKEFLAIGTFVRGKLRPVEEELGRHPEWTEAGVETALRTAGAKFPASAKADLVRTIPLKAIRTYSGCQLEPNSASLISRRVESTPEGTKAEIRWDVQGHRGKIPCSASFEPFEGRLIQIF